MENFIFCAVITISFFGSQKSFIVPDKVTGTSSFQKFLNPLAVTENCNDENFISAVILVPQSIKNSVGCENSLGK